MAPPQTVDKQQLGDRRRFLQRIANEAQHEVLVPGGRLVVLALHSSPTKTVPGRGVMAGLVPSIHSSSEVMVCPSWLVRPGGGGPVRTTSWSAPFWKFARS